MVDAEEGFLLESKTKVRKIDVKAQKTKINIPTPEVIELPEREISFGTRFLQLDRLVRNFAVVGSLVLVMIAIRSSNMEETQSVFSALQTGTGMQWDESIGKLSFVNNLLPEEIQTVWNENKEVSVYAPVNGEIVHAWSEGEPYLLIRGKKDEVFASADGEVMSIAHGLGEERIVRVRHADQSETVYGNLQECVLEIGQLVHAGELLGKLIPDHPLAFEVRVNGRPVKIDDQLKTFQE